MIRAQDIMTLRANTLKAVEALEDRLTPEEKATILAAADRASAAPVGALALLLAAVRNRGNLTASRVARPVSRRRAA
jgi:hypothetical protein